MPPMAELFGKDLAFPLVSKLATLRHRATYAIRWHSHDELEIHFVFSGALTYEFARGPGPRTIPGGHFFVVPAHKRHRAANDKGAPASRLGLQFCPPTEAAARQTVFEAAELRRLFAAFGRRALVPVRFRAKTGALAREVSRLAEAWEDVRARPESAAHLRALVCTLLVEAFGDLRAGDGPASLAPERVVEAVRAHIDAHCAEPLSVDDLVRLSGYGRTRLFALFAAQAGTTPIDYLNRRRVARAQELLEDAARPLGEVAEACGFASADYFARVFRKYVGLSPQEFRRGCPSPPLTR